MLNQNGILQPLQKLLKESLENVSVGLSAIESYSPNTRHAVPADYIPLSFGEPEILKKVSRSEVRRRKDSFKVWILTRGFQECSKALQASLREAYLYVRMAAVDFNQITTAGQLNAAIKSAQHEAAWLQVPKLIEGISSSLTAPIALREHVLSINKVRNCLEHRYGVVSGQDINERVTDSLVLRWRRGRLVANKGDHHFEVGPGSRVEAGYTINLGFEDKSRSFARGETVDISVAEFNEVAMTCLLFGQDLAHKLPVVTPEQSTTP
jgi:hypothetical protein